MKPSNFKGSVVPSAFRTVCMSELVHPGSVGVRGSSPLSSTHKPQQIRGVHDSESRVGTNRAREIPAMLPGNAFSAHSEECSGTYGSEAVPGFGDAPAASRYLGRADAARAQVA